MIRIKLISAQRLISQKVIAKQFNKNKKNRLKGHRVNNLLMIMKDYKEKTLKVFFRKWMKIHQLTRLMDNLYLIQRFCYKGLINRRKLNYNKLKKLFTRIVFEKRILREIKDLGYKFIKLKGLKRVVNFVKLVILNKLKHNNTYNIISTALKKLNKFFKSKMRFIIKSVSNYKRVKVNF